MKDHTKDFLELIRLCSTQLPKDVEQRITECMEKEGEGSTAKSILAQILKNWEMARDRSLPICQDTGTNLYWIDYPPTMSEKEIREQITEATKQATAKNYLRPNSVDSVTGKNTGDNIGEGHPSFHFRQSNEDFLKVTLMLKGGGSENISTQYRLPDMNLKAGRDFAGVAKCVRDAVLKAQGLGCAPGIIGVCIGGDRAASYEYSKMALLRRLGDMNLVPELAVLERKLIEELNTSGIGPMGLGGKTTVLDVKIVAANRVPACYFVSVSYMCWACRRKTMTIKNGIVKYE